MANDLAFGATPTGDGTRFRLWAPTAERVALAIEGRDEIACERDEAGWVDIHVAGVEAGARYRYRINGETYVPDPASRFQPDDVDGPSEVVDPDAYRWPSSGWAGRPWAEAVIYEAHVGTATPEGTYAALADRLDDLVATGITALQLMPLSSVPGKRNWGYDGVLPYAPEDGYGTPADLKRLIDKAHGVGLMVFLDVVYNHFGPSGNYLPLYAGHMFDEGTPTPWGAAMDVRSARAKPVREFIIQNALYWLQEYRFDGLRLDAVHALIDDGAEHVLHELARRARESVGPDRHIHLIVENEHNDADLLTRVDGDPKWYTAQWNDDVHHCWHVLLTGETDSYYDAYKDDPADLLAKSLASGFAYQGEAYGPRDGEPRGTPSAHLPPGAFINFLQNHDQIGNRAFGERLTVLADEQKLRMATACLLLAPQPPMLFQGEDHGETNPFLFFCDFTDPDLQNAVRDGRRREFAAFPQFAQRINDIPDATDRETFEQSKTDIGRAGDTTFVRELLSLRHEHVVPLLRSGWQSAEGHCDDRGVISVVWTFNSAQLQLQMNLSDEPARVDATSGKTIYASAGTEETLLPASTLRFTTEELS